MRGGEEGARTEDDEARAVLLAAGAHQRGRVVDDGHEVRVVGGLSGGAAGRSRDVPARGTGRDEGTPRSSGSSRGAQLGEDGPGGVHGREIGGKGGSGG